MPGLFFLATDLGPSGAAKTLALLGPALAEQNRVAVGVLGRPGGPFDAALVETGFPPVPLPIRGPFDVAGLREARKWIRAFDPHAIHAIGPAAVRLAQFVAYRGIGNRKPCPIIASAADRPSAGLRGWLTRKRLRGADQVIAATRAEADRYRRLGVPAERVAVIPPGVLPAVPPPDPAALRKMLGIPDGGRLVIAAGGFDLAASLRSAVWAFDVIRYTVPDVYLVLVGDGPDRGRTEQFARGLAFDDYRVRFAGTRPDVPALLGLAEVVWVTHTRGGVNLALEAMAAGKPVVAANTPDLVEVIEDGVTGRLVPPEDRVGLAAVTNELLSDPDLASRLGTTGQTRAVERHPVSAMTDRYALLYKRMLGG